MTAARFAIAVLLTSAAGQAALFHRDTSEGAAERAPAITLRKRLHVNPLITEPGTMDIEYGGSFSWDGSYTLPMALHYTPEGPYAWWGRTEFSASLDSVSSDNGVHFGDRATFAATCVAHDGEKLDFAIAPQVSVLLRGDSGARLGATVITRYDVGRSSAGVTASWSAATRSSPTNPAATFDLGLGYGFRLKPSGALGHLTPHVNWLWEKSTGIERQISFFEGVEYQITDPVAVDFALQHVSLWGGAPDRQFVVGLTVNTGRLRHR
jgi:hypothetical protein